MTSQDKIDYIEIPAKDPQRARDFFSGLFGWAFEDYGPDYCSFNDGRIYGGFYRSDAVVAVAAGAPLIVYYRENLEEATQKVEELGGAISKAIFSFPGGHRFHFTDPNGNEYAIWSDKHSGANDDA
jgi:predicted enzyme related to lactoylglutathione lyase